MFGLNFGGNPLVMELIQTPQTDIDKLLDIDSFPGQFRTCNPKLQKYMDISKYNRLVEYVTQVGDPNNRNRAYRYPLAASQILSIDNKCTLDALLNEDKIIIDKVEIQQKWVEKEVDECDSQYCSSQGSNRNAQDFFESSNEENIPPQGQKIIRAQSIKEKKKLSEKSSDGESQGRKSLRASSSSITSDDFPFAEIQRKIVKVKQIIKKTTKVQIKPLLNQLCQYFQNEINYTLTGYVTKILEYLLKKNSHRILRQIFLTKVHKSLIKHIDSQVVCDFIVNMLTNTQNQAQNAREYFLDILVKNLISWSQDEQKMIYNKSISYILVELNNKLDPYTSKWHAALLTYLYQLNSFSKVAALIFDPKTTNKNRETFTNLLHQLLKKVINPIIINPQNTAQSAMRTSQSQSIKQLRHKLLAKYQACFKQFIDKTWENVIQIGQNKLPSYVYIKQLQLLNCLIKNNLFWSRMQLANQESIFQPLLELCKKFSFNNFIHNLIFDLLKQFVHLSDDFPLLFKKAFNCKNFIIFCLQTVSESGKYSKSMYKGQCIYLCDAIRHNTSETALEFKTQNKAKWSKIQQCILNNVEKINSTLGGFSVKRPHKTQVQFSKQSIIERFECFLKGEIPMKKKKSLEEQQLEDIGSQGSAQWNDWNEFSNYSADEVDEKNQSQ